MAHDPVSGDGGHVFAGLVHAPAALEPERKGDRVGEIAGIGGRELVVVGRGARVWRVSS
jgi:hypothetical protein